VLPLRHRDEDAQLLERHVGFHLRVTVNL
jgi:hypothetical protein